MPKVNRNGKALTLTPQQLDSIMVELSPIARAVFQMCRYTAARINEALSLKWENVLQDYIIIPKAITKKKVATRSIPLNPALEAELKIWSAEWASKFKREVQPSDHIFPGSKDFNVHMTRQNVDYALRLACKRLGIQGVSTHSFRRSALTIASGKGIPLRELQEISGHQNLSNLQKYIDVSEEAKKRAVLAFG